MMLTENRWQGRRLALITAIMAALVAALVLPARAFAVQDLYYNPPESVNPVADNVTRLEMNKFEKGTDKALPGAKMVIIDEVTGEVVHSWTTGEGAEVIEKKLNVDTWYIMREVEAPAGYATAPDTRFILRSEDFNTVGEISNQHDDVEFSVISGAGPEQAFVINLYDRLEVEEERHVQREVKRKLPQTSDLFDPTIALIVGAGGIAAVVVGIIVRRRSN